MQMYISRFTVHTTHCLVPRPSSKRRDMIVPQTSGIWILPSTLLHVETINGFTWVHLPSVWIHCSFVNCVHDLYGKYPGDILEGEIWEQLWSQPLSQSAVLHIQEGLGDKARLEWLSFLLGKRLGNSTLHVQMLLHEMFYSMFALSTEVCKLEDCMKLSLVVKITPA